MKGSYSTLFTVALASVCPMLADEIPSKQVQFKKGTSSATIKGSVTGDDCFDYKLGAKAGQSMSVSLETGTPSQYFNVIAPDGGETLHVGSMSDSESFKGKLPTDGVYTIRVYLMGNARDTDLTVPHTLQVSITDPAPEAEVKEFDKSLSLQGITFTVKTATDDDGKRRLTVTPEGLEIDNSTQTTVIDGHVTGAEVADLNADGSPEVYVFTRNDDKRAALHAWSTNRKKSLSDIYLPEPAPSDVNFAGFSGNDEFAVVENVIARRFPIPGGKTRQIQYKLHAGEANWQLKIDRVVEY